MATEVVIKKWGNSMGVVLPKDLVETQGLEENEKVFITVIKEGDLSDIFGSLKLGVPVQKLKDMVRKGWE